MRFDLLACASLPYFGTCADNSGVKGFSSTMENTKRFRSVQDTAKQFDLNPRTVRRLIQSGKIHGVRIGRSLRISESEIRRIARDGCSERTESKRGSSGAAA